LAVITQTIRLLENPILMQHVGLIYIGGRWHSTIIILFLKHQTNQSNRCFKRVRSRVSSNIPKGFEKKKLERRKLKDETKKGSKEERIKFEGL
jgi:hypothetical protein